MICKIGHGSELKNIDKKAYLEKEAEKEIPMYERTCKNLDKDIYSSVHLKNSSSLENEISTP